ncbi:MAG: hypothetical protein HY646_07035 [Acidobacteria bacterium]|nr:hypothetical protein [Acidobacteriota bacterium]
MPGHTTGWREFLHGEHAACYRLEQANHYLADGRWKYIWYSHTGREQLFHLAEDPHEVHDLARQADVTRWRNRLIAQLRHRPESFTDGQRLIAGRPQLPVVPQPT